MSSYEKLSKLWLIVLVIAVLGVIGHFTRPKDIDVKYAQIQSIYKPNVGQMWSGSYNNAVECNGFAQLVFHSLFGINIGGYDGSKPYMLKDESTVELVGRVSGAKFSNRNEIKKIFMNARCGDFVQINGSSAHHSAIVSKVDDGGVTLYDCNYCLRGETMRNLIHERKVTWTEMVQICGKGDGSDTYGMSIYRAPNYDKRYKQK